MLNHSEVSLKMQKGISAALLALLAFAPMLQSCAGSMPGVSLGVGSHGVGVGMHSGYGLYPGYGMYSGYGHAWHGRPYGGVVLGMPGGMGGPEGGTQGRVVDLPPERPPVTEESRAAWNRYDAMYHSLLPYYRGKPFMSRAK